MVHASGSHSRKFRGGAPGKGGSVYSARREARCMDRAMTRSRSGDAPSPTLAEQRQTRQRRIARMADNRNLISRTTLPTINGTESRPWRLYAAAWEIRYRGIAVSDASRSSPQARSTSSIFPPEYAASVEQVARLLKEKKVPTIQKCFTKPVSLGQFHLIACSAGLEYMGVEVAAVERSTWTNSGSPRFSR